jgi:hypothetical protein
LGKQGDSQKQCLSGCFCRAQPLGLPRDPRPPPFDCASRNSRDAPLREVAAHSAAGGAGETPRSRIVARQALNQARSPALSGASRLFRDAQSKGAGFRTSPGHLGEHTPCRSGSHATRGHRPERRVQARVDPVGLSRLVPQQTLGQGNADFADCTDYADLTRICVIGANCEICVSLTDGRQSTYACAQPPPPQLHYPHAPFFVSSRRSLQRLQPVTHALAHGA